jgi:hypothetical protein
MMEKGNRDLKLVVLTLPWRFVRFLGWVTGGKTNYFDALSLHESSDAPQYFVSQSRTK